MLRISRHWRLESGDPQEGPGLSRDIVIALESLNLEIATSSEAMLTSRNAVYLYRIRAVE